MSDPSLYVIEIRGRVNDRVLHPFVDDFSVSPTARGTTCLVGEIRDPSHLHGVLAHLTSMNVEVIELRRIDSDDECVGPPVRPPHPRRKRNLIMTITAAVHAPSAVDAGRRSRLSLVGGVAALVAAATFVYGIAMFATTMVDYTDDASTPAESVDFLVGHQDALLAWYIGIYIVFGAALVPLGLALRERLAGAPILSDVAAVFAMVWVSLMFATGMVANIGIEAVADLAESDPDGAVALWTSIDTVANGLGGGNEVVGAAWIGLVSVAGLLTTRLPRWLNLVGVVTAVAGVNRVRSNRSTSLRVANPSNTIWVSVSSAKSLL